MAKPDTSTRPICELIPAHMVAKLGGRAWYTAGGHTDESFTEELSLKHISEGIRWAGHLELKNYRLAPQKRLPSDEHFEVEELVSNLEDPMEIAVFRFKLGRRE